MNHIQKYLSMCLIALAALFSAVSMAWAATAPALGTASNFSVLGGTAVTCTGSVITGDVGTGGIFTDTGCMISGGMPPATDLAVAGALADFLSAYNILKSNIATPCTGTLLSTITGPMTLPPGVYCTDGALTGAGVLTLDGGGNTNAVWVFKIGAAFTGTGFSVVMANGGQACNVFWVPSADVTMTTSALGGNILAGGAGSITLTGGTLAGRVLANIAVTMTNANVIGCSALPPPVFTCKDKDHDMHHHGHDKDDHDDKGHEHDGKDGKDGKK